MIYVSARVSNGDTVTFSGCWILTESEANAKNRSALILSNSGWVLDEILEVYAIGSDHYNSGDEGEAYYNQAITDGEVCVIFKSKS